MYLEKLEISGFKSFANKNKLIFSGLVDGEKRGLTAIVGPNGSGKSNVADAIRWALGEQSIKTLRGKKGEDVIFSGSDKKARLGSAEVSLYLNNEDISGRKVRGEEANLIAGEESAENGRELDNIIKTCSEISITRRLFRNGDSEYLINNSRARLTDIQMLLAKANFGQKTYSVIGQGMVENFLSVSAAERKDFFDEATGVKQFQIKRESALNKLEASYENLQQVDMLLAEIKPRLKSLTRQVEKLKRREEIEAELKNNQITYYSSLWHSINQRLKNANQGFLELEKEKLEKEKRLEKTDEELNKLRGAENFKEINELEPRLREKESQKNQILKQLAKLQAELEAKLEAQGQFDVAWLSNKKSELETELENIVFEITSLKKNEGASDEDILRNKISEINKEIGTNNSLRHEIRLLKEEKSLEERKISKIEAIIEANIEMRGQFDVSALKIKREELSSSLLKIENDLAAIENTRDESKAKAVSAEIIVLEAKTRELNSALENINRELKKNKDKIGGKEEIERIIDEFLARLDEIGKENNLETVKKLVAEAKELFRTKIKAAVAGEDLESLEKIRGIQEEIIALTDKRQALNTSLNEERMRLAAENEKASMLNEKKRQAERELNEVKINLEKAESDFDATGLENDKRETKKKITAIDLKVENLEKEDKLSELEEKKRTAEAEYQDWRIKDSSLRERARLLERKKTDLENELSNVKAKIEKSQIKFDAGQIKNEETALNKKIEDLNIEIAEINESLSKLYSARDQEKSKMFEIQKTNQGIQQELNSILNRLSSLKMETTRQETKLEDLEGSIRNEDLNISEIENTKIDDELDVDAIAKRISSAKNQMEQIGGIDPESEKEYEETKSRFDFLSAQTDDLEKAISSLEEVIMELDKNIKNKFDAEFKVISEKFSEYFKILFNGGSAKISKLSLEDAEANKKKTKDENSTAIDAALMPEEIAIKNEIGDKLKKIRFLKKHNSADLEGIDVQAVPPGKKIQTVTMLSGGERALTAIALICAIISANPSPFVVLDEVDAALDEANSERLARILDDLSDKTQFIVITHNRAAMRKASILYGVTMESDGVSKLLSVKLDEMQK